MVADEKEPEESQYFDWSTRMHPWDLLYAQKAFNCFKSDTVVTPVEVTHVKDRNFIEMWTEFVPRPIEDMVNEFFDGKHALHLGRNAHYWILWSVTQGKWRMTKNRTMFRFMGDDPEIQKMRAMGDNWDRVTSAKMSFCPNLVAITDTCNFLHTTLLTRLRGIDNGRKTFQIRLKNFSELPEFVPVQRNRDHYHKKHRWEHAKKSQGGELPDLPAQPSVPHKINSVHFMLREYHEWLPPVFKAQPI